MPRSSTLTPTAKALLKAATVDPVGAESPTKRPRTTWRDWEPALKVRLARGERPITTIDWFIRQWLKLHPDEVYPEVKSAPWQRFAAVVYRLAKAGADVHGSGFLVPGDLKQDAGGSALSP